MAKLSKESLQMIKEARGNENIREITPEDTFHFNCTACGSCCKNRVDGSSILLSPHDIHKLSQTLNRTEKEVIQKYTNMHIGSSSGIPMMTLKSIKTVFDLEPKCVFLSSGKCDVHTKKPDVCKLFPLGRVSTPDGDIGYFHQGDVECGGLPKEHTLDEWFPDREESEKAFVEYSKHLRDVVETTSLKKIIADERVTNNTRDLMVSAYITSMYCDYDSEKDYAEQFSEHNERYLNQQRVVDTGYRVLMK